MVVRPKFKSIPHLLLLAFCLTASWSGCQKIEARSLAKEGNSLYKSGKYQQALLKFQQAEKLDPHFPTLQLHLGYVGMALASAHEAQTAERYAKVASRAFETFMRLAPSDERGPRFYLQVLLDSGRHQDALKFLLQQHRKNPRDLKIVASLGVVSSRAGKFSEALKWYEKRADLLPKEAKAHYLIGTLCWKHLYQNEEVVGAERIKLADQGLDALRKALTLRPEYAEALTYTNLLFRERAKGQTDPLAREKDMHQARAYYQKALALIKKSKGPGQQPSPKPSSQPSPQPGSIKAKVESKGEEPPQRDQGP